MTKTIAVCNQKGGVGKTTTSVNLGASLALTGARVLLVDLDPQANATGGLGIDKKSVANTIYQLLFARIRADQAALSTKVQNLSLIPSQVALSGAEIEMVGLPRREERLKAALEPIKGSYDLILIDAPPSLGLLTINALTAADAVLIPLQCEYYALEGLSQLLETIRLVQGALNPSLEIEGVILTMADFRTKLTSDVIREVRQFFGSKAYDFVVPRSVRISEAPSHGLPINLYDPSSPGAQIYQLLAEKVKENLHVREQRVGQGDTGSHSGAASPEPVSKEIGGTSPGTDSGDPGQSVPASKES